MYEFEIEIEYAGQWQPGSKVAQLTMCRAVAENGKTLDLLAHLDAEAIEQLQEWVPQDAIENGTLFTVSKHLFYVNADVEIEWTGDGRVHHMGDASPPELDADIQTAVALWTNERDEQLDISAFVRNGAFQDAVDEVLAEELDSDGDY